MLSLLLLFPAVMCLGGAVMMALSMRADLETGALRWQDPEMAIGAAIILACVVAFASADAGAAGALTR